ncbi:MAG: putative bifunctional diguanylate cyclase/phosphodiesterase, partial [Rhodospirillaceae bacterium]
MRSTGGVFGPALEQLTTWFAQFDDWMEGNAAGAEIVGRVVVTFTDITAQQEQEQTLRKLSMAVEQSSASVVITDINGIIEYVNQTFERISGYSAEEAVGKTPRILRSGKVPPATYKELWTTITAGQEWRGEMENRRKDGTYYWESTVVSPIRDDQGQITHFVAVKDDITDRKVMQDELFRQANYDSLTGLPNRQLALDRLRQALAPLTRGEKSQIGILFMDLDHFKKVNDTQGHDAGDALLQEASMRFRTVLRPQDTLARLGGDEFLIILPELPGASMAAAIASRLINCAQAPFFINGHEHHLSSSVGVAMAPADGTEPESLLKNADAAMYRAKDQGRGVSYFFTSDVAESISRRLVLERRLRETLRETAKDGEGHGLKLNLQPLMNIQRGDIEGCEVLCRWVDQELGPVSPGEFIPVAEECGLVEDLGQWILNEACHQAAMIQPWVDPGFRVCINASPIQFSRDSYPGQVRSALERSGVEPGLLEIE